MKTLLIILLTFLVVKTTFGQGFWNKSATIRSDGVMEIGKYIDFHETNSDPNDYSIRLYSNNGILGLNGSFNIYGDLNLSSGLITSNKLLLNDPNDIDNWNNLWQCGFFQGYNIVNAPESSGWFWGINMGHNGNSSTYRYNGQIAIKNSPTSPTMYFRSTNKDGEGDWAKLLINNGDFSSLTGNTLLLNDPNNIDNWNNLWQCGFYQGYNIVNAPESSGWFWGINMGHNGNSSTYKHNGQIAIKNDYDSPTMYFRSTAESGEGVWAKVLNDNGNQQINGNLTVAGKLLSREVKVTIDAGADFVFKANYELKDLDHLENFIKKNKHLPDIQTEKEMIENGLNINEFQIKLLQKIEELTLYTIEQNKKIKDLEDIIQRNDLK